MKRCIVVGLDGATWDLIQPWAEAGTLPTFQKILSRATWGILKSTNPPLTSPGWPSFFSGKNPGKHGVYDFVEPHGKRISNGSLVRTEALWEILSRNDKKCIVQNVPLTFPPRAINGVMITDMMAAPGEVFTHPASLTDSLNADGYTIDVLFERPKEKKKSEVVALINRIERQHMDVFKSLLAEQQWDFAMLAVTGMDRLQHYYWDDTALLQQHYALVDGMIAELFAQYEETTDFVFLSDHGFCGKTVQLDLNTWLEQNGYLRWTTTSNTSAGESWMDKTFYKKSKPGVAALLRRIGITHDIIGRHRVLQAIVHRIPRRIRKKLGSHVAQSKRTPDWQETRAYIPTGIVRGINVNLIGREPHGIVPQESYESVREQIIQQLKQLRTPNGVQVFRNVFKREEVYHGPFVHEAYDILFELADDSILSIAKHTGKLFSPSAHAGYHHEDGMFALYGNTFNHSRTSARLEDLAPTILHAFGCAVPSSMDGAVLTQAFREQHPVRIANSEKESLAAVVRHIRL